MLLKSPPIANAAAKIAMLMIEAMSAYSTATEPLHTLRKRTIGRMAPIGFQSWFRRSRGLIGRVTFGD